MNKDRLYLTHILECIERIESYMKSGEDALFNNTMVQDAILRNLHTLTESTQRISNDLKQQNTAVDWRKIAAFRNVIVHGYLGIDMMVICSILKNDLPDLKEKITTILSQLS